MTDRLHHVPGIRPATIVRASARPPFDPALQSGVDVSIDTLSRPRPRARARHVAVEAQVDTLARVESKPNEEG